jgi:hypothetical protein
MGETVSAHKIVIVKYNRKRPLGNTSIDGMAV